jgi:hypothetical protein
MSNNDDTVRANPGYALGQLARALLTSEAHEDPQTRERAASKVQKWNQVFEGMLSGSLQVGSRTPVAAPGWATLEVVKGGFATGTLLAGGPLQPHEEELLDRLSLPRNGRERASLNAYFLGDAGLEELRRWLASGCYRVHVPEEGALLVVAWLLDHGQADRARQVLDAIGPYLGTLRFYPIPHTQPLTATSLVRLQDIGSTIENLERRQVRLSVCKMRETIQVWAGLEDRVVELFLETVEGPTPHFRAGTDGKPVPNQAGTFDLVGGWPCQHYPEGWFERARALLAEYAQTRQRHSLCARPESRKSNFARLRRYLQRCVDDPRALTGRDVGMIRWILAGIVSKRGVPDSETCRTLREQQANQATRPTTAELAQVLVGRLQHFPSDEGLDQLDEVSAPISKAEAERAGVPVGQVIPDVLRARLQRSLNAPLEVLVEQRVINSGEVLARVLPRLSAPVHAAGVADPALRTLYCAVYRAFRRRRSLLLLNLESQIKLEELPWVAALGAECGDDLARRAQARELLDRVAALTIRTFPQVILPNKLLQEVRALVDAAGLELPLVDEVAADIFMGTFSEKYLRAAQQAGELLQGTLYETYYGVRYARVRDLKDVRRSWFGARTSTTFTTLCHELAGESTSGRHWSVARNGKIIEQEQILTTHNLAVLFAALGLGEKLKPDLQELARRCFTWVCRRQQAQVTDWRPRLRMLKNSAYAWRQMIFYLSLLPSASVQEFLKWASARLAEQRPAFRERFQPALLGLQQAAAGREPSGEARRFLGWTTEKHWLLA